MYVYLCVRVWVCKYFFVFEFICVCICVFGCLCVLVYVCVWLCFSVCLWVCACVYVCVWSMYMFVCGQGHKKGDFKVFFPIMIRTYGRVWIFIWIANYFSSLKWMPWDCYWFSVQLRSVLGVKSLFNLIFLLRVQNWSYFGPVYFTDLGWLG